MKISILCLIGFSAIAPSLRPAVLASEQQTVVKTPVIFDAMTFRNKPDLGLSNEMNFIYEWEATLRDEAIRLRASGSDKMPSARTVEADAFSRAVRSRARFKYIVIDIESLKPQDDKIAIDYVELGKAAAPASKVAWWNLGPRYIENTFLRPFKRKEWQAEFDNRKKLVEANDFCILGAYLESDDTIETWRARQVPRIAEARRLYHSKPIFVTLAPHYFGKGKPWPFISGKMLGEVMDILADHQVDGIVLWSFEGTGQIQPWDDSRDWVRAVRERTGPGGRYKRPAQLQ